MRIANPLYDHAFKYLMSNNRLAKKVLSVILDKEVLELELSQQEMVVEDDVRMFTLYRLDFKAKIRDQDGRVETVLIELQKSKLPTNMLRFRSYLGMAYSQKPTVPAVVGADDEVYPIISIYIMGYNIVDIPVMAIKVDRRIVDVSLQQEVDIQSDFIDMLTHTCHILQVRRLPEQRRTRIERFLSLFNQAWVKEENYILDLEDVPEEFKDLAEYLARPLLNTEMRLQLQAEQEVDFLMSGQEARIQDLEAQAEQARVAMEAAQAKIEQERAEKEAAQAQAKATTLKYARLLLQSGQSAAEVAQETGLSIEAVQNLKVK